MSGKGPIFETWIRDKENNESLALIHLLSRGRDGSDCSMYWHVLVPSLLFLQQYIYWPAGGPQVSAKPILLLRSLPGVGKIEECRRDR